jgi:predicted Rossmann fold nucleotide-binding protein DprA/Smf involved in DNA uptake
MKKTIDYIKEKRTFSEELTKKRKEFTRIRKLILKSLETEPKTIPQVARESGLPLDVVTYNLMTLRKYGEIETGEVDDMDEYYYYQLVKKKS